MHFIGFQFSNESILNWLLLTTVHSTTLALNTCHIYYILIGHRASLLSLPQSRLPTSYRHCSCLSWFSTCWPFPLEFPPSSPQIYRLLHCLQIQSKNAPILWCKHLWPLAISIFQNPTDCRRGCSIAVSVS